MGCLVGILGVVFFIGLISWSFYQGLGQNKAIDLFTVPDAAVQPVAKLDPAAVAALDQSLREFAAALDTGARAEVKIPAAALNHMIATDDRLADLRGQLFVTGIAGGVVKCAICYPLNGLPWENRKRYLIGNLNLQPELKDGHAAFRVVSIEVPGRTLPKWFIDGFSIYHLLERYQKDETIARRLNQLSALTAEGDTIVMRSKAWKESN